MSADAVPNEGAVALADEAAELFEQIDRMCTLVAHPRECVAGPELTALLDGCRRRAAEAHDRWAVEQRRKARDLGADDAAIAALFAPRGGGASR